MATEEVGIRLTLAGRREAAAGLKDTATDLDQVGSAAESAGNKAEASGRKFDRTRGILGAMGRGAVYGAKLLGAVGVAGAAIGIKTAAGMETAKIGFTTMLGSAKKANVFLRDLSKFAAKTPFEFPELQTAASSLISAGINADKVIPIMTTLGDVTAGMGTGSEGIKRATVALQQMNAAGRITGEDLNQLRDAGIPVYDLLAAATGRSKAAVTALAQEGKLGAEDLKAMMGALETGKGLEKFNGLMKKQSGSLSGTWSTLTDTVNMGLAKAIKPALPLIKDMVLGASDLAEKAMPAIGRGVKTGVDAIKSFVTLVKGGGIRDALDDLSAKGSADGASKIAVGLGLAAEAAGFLVDQFKGGGIKDALAGLSAPDTSKGASGIADNLRDIGASIRDVDWGAVKDGIGEGVADTVSVFGVAIGFAADHIDDFAKYLPFLVAGLAAWKVAQAAGNVAAVAAVPITVAQTVSNFALAGALRAQAAATTTTEVAQRGLNLALLANPIGLVIAAIALLVGGFILLYKKSETFRGLVDIIWSGVLKPFAQWIGDKLLGAILKIASGLLGMAANGVLGFRLLLQAAFRAFDGILSAAEAGLGWIPGIGDKIKGARAAFDRFGDATINKLQRVEERLRTTQAAVDGLARDRTATITIYAKQVGAVGGGGASGNGGGRGGQGVPGARAAGGPVTAGRPYIVGEKRPELFVPKVSGTILPRIPASTTQLKGLDSLLPSTRPFEPPRPRDARPEKISSATQVKGTAPGTSLPRIPASATQFKSLDSLLATTRPFEPRDADRVNAPRVPEVEAPEIQRFRSSQMPSVGDVVVYLDGKEISRNTMDRVTAKVARA